MSESSMKKIKLENAPSIRIVLSSDTRKTSSIATVDDNIPITSNVTCLASTSSSCNRERSSQIGVSSFSELVQQDNFVDNTLFIYNFLHSAYYAQLIIAPKSSGKSVNIDMIKTFLEIETEDDGLKVTDITKTKNYRLFTKQPEGKKLKISEKKECMKNLGKYPVIYVDFASVTGDDFDTILNQIKCALSKTFQQHEQTFARLLKKDIEDHNKIFQSNYCTKSRDISYMVKLINEKNINLSRNAFRFKQIYYTEKSLTDFDVKISLGVLCDVLYDHFKERVFVLVDEYDTPVNVMKLKSSQDDSYCIDDFIVSLFGYVIKGNDKVERGLLTGTALLVRGLGSTPLNNVIPIRITDSHKYAEYFRFTDKQKCDK